jgi:hypothetical protein
MREDLLGYLLSALEPHEMRRIDQRLREDPQLREELAEMQQKLSQLDQSLAMEELVEVPPTLVSQTLELISSHGGDDPVYGGGNGLSASLPQATAPLVMIRPGREPLCRPRRSVADLLVSGLAAVAIFGFALPMVARFRSDARSVACQDNLRQLGVAISQFVLREREAYLPGLAESGPEAFAGIYAVRLADRGLLLDSRLRWCPETKLPEPDPSVLNLFLTDASSPVKPLTHLVSGGELDRAAEKSDVSWLRWLQRVAGGHYAYSLGVVDGDRYRAPRYEGRSTFAVLGDAPLSGGHATDAVDVTKMRWSHGGEGANLLYEDGSVRHVRMSAMLEMLDHPYVNHRGSIEAGVNIDDASLAPSWRSPFMRALQR